MSGSRHFVVVEAYDGLVEMLTADPAELRTARGLGLPLDELAAALDARFTVLTWDAWKRDEARFGSPFTWEWPALTRPAVPPPLPPPPPDLGSRVRWREIAAREPYRGLPLDRIAESPPALGLLARNDLLVLLAAAVRAELERLFRDDPFGAVLVPQWGGLGALAQTARAAGTASFDVPFAAVVTDLSVRRQELNQEGLWTRPAVVRRQAEDLSLALADAALVFGSRGEAAARAGRLPDAAPPVRAPRRVDRETLEAIAAAAERPAQAGVIQPFLDEPQDGASGVLTALDAARLLAEHGAGFGRPLLSTGPAMVFVPMRPRLFADYWGSRGWVRELIEAGRWSWQPARPAADGALPLRLYPSRFEHLPDIWTELARGSAVLLSPAAAEGLAPGEELPADLLLASDPDPETLAARLAALAEMGPERIDAARRLLCGRVAAAHKSTARQELLEGTAATLGRLLEAGAPQALDRVARGLVDRRRSVVEAEGDPHPRPLSHPHSNPPGRGETSNSQNTTGFSASCLPSPGGGVGGAGRGAGVRAPLCLTVVIPCHEMGPLLAETVESVWAAERLPDEVLVVDDGSRGEATRACLADLEREAAGRRVPLTVIRQGNRGLAGARNAGLAAARGRYISFLDGDDLIEPPFYRLGLGILERWPGLGGVAAWSVCFGADGIVGYWNPPQPELPFLFVENCVFVPCLMRTELLRRLGGYDEGQRFNYEDWELSVRLLAAGWPIVTIPDVLARYRVRPDSLLRTLTPAQNQVMRERLLATHRETASRFSLEIAMQIEHRWKTLEAETAAKTASGRSTGWNAGMKKAAKRILRRVAR